MIPSAGIATIRREEAPVEQSLESHSEVIALRVERVSGMLYRPGLLARSPDIGIWFCDEDVESAHTWMSVRREVEVAIGTECWEFLISGSINRFTHILYGDYIASGSELCAPYIKSSHSPRHVRSEIEPTSIWGNCGMSEIRESIP